MRALDTDYELGVLDQLVIDYQSDFERQLEEAVPAEATSGQGGYDGHGGGGGGQHSS